MEEESHDKAKMKGTLTGNALGVLIILTLQILSVSKYFIRLGIEFKPVLQIGIYLHLKKGLLTDLTCRSCTYKYHRVISSLTHEMFFSI